MFDWFCNCNKLNKKLDKIMATINEQLTAANTKLDTALTAVGDLQTDVQALVNLTELLKQQVAEGQADPALVEQIAGKVSALADSIGAIDTAVEAETGVTTP